MEYLVSKNENIGNIEEYAKFIYERVQDGKRNF